MPTSGFFPVPSSTSATEKLHAQTCDNCARLLKIFEQMRTLPLNQRVSYVYMGLINEALEGK